MPGFLRITLLGVCGVVGAAVAVCLAITSEPDSGSGSSPSQASSVEDRRALPQVARDRPAAESESPPAEKKAPVRLAAEMTITDGALPAEIGPPSRSSGSSLESMFPIDLAPKEHASTSGPQLNRPLFKAADLPADSPADSPTETHVADRRVVDTQTAQAPPPDSRKAAEEDRGEAVPPGPETVPQNRVALQPGEGDDRLTINAQGEDIQKVLGVLSEAAGINILASKSVRGPVSLSLKGVSALEALDAILKSTGYVARRDGKFIYVGTPEDFRSMDHALDTVGTRVYRPNYVKAAELQALIAPMLTPDIGTISVSSTAEVGIAPDSNQSGGDNFAGADVLLVRDYEAVLAQVDQVVDEVDRRPLQVSIEAMILSVKLDDSLKIGVDFELLRDRNNARLISGSPLSDLANIDLTEGGLKFGFLDSSLGAFINALETVGDTNVIASPRLMVLNKQRAEILIGAQRGYVSTTVTENAATQSVEFLEVGTQLRIRPFISSDGMVRLEVHPELSTGEVRIENNFTLPDKEVTQVTTNIMCRDGATVVIGGLIREDLGKTTSQIPLFGSLPLVGAAFRTQTDTTDRREIIVLITPKIVRETEAYCEGSRGACEFHHRQAVYADKMSKLGKRFYGRRYLRLAKAAWAAGDAYTALRNINMSIHFDPMNREAINFRAMVVANSPYGDNSVDSHLRIGLAPWNQPKGDRVHDEWVVDRLDHRPHGYLPRPLPESPPAAPRVRDLHRPQVSSRRPPPAADQRSRAD